MPLLKVDLSKAGQLLSIIGRKRLSHQRMLAFIPPA
jgi:hypothetical protein